MSTAETVIATAVRATPQGYVELSEKPAATELAAYYAQKYYQQSLRTHKPRYDEAEHRWRQLRLAQKLAMAQRHLAPAAGEGSGAGTAPRRFLDVGAGEGFAMAYFDAQGWQVSGIDHSRHACETHHPQLLNRLHTGDIDTALDRLAHAGERYALILLDNVLEHLLDPLATLGRLRGLLAEGGVLILEVPNDFSPLQTHLQAQGHIDRPFWVVAPDHVSYFNAAGLRALCEAAGLAQCALMGDFPIDLALLNPATNYVRDKAVGPAVHRARVEAETLIDSLSRDGALALYEALATLGLGRALVGFYQRAPDPLSLNSEDTP